MNDIPERSPHNIHHIPRGIGLEGTLNKKLTMGHTRLKKKQQQNSFDKLSTKKKKKNSEK